MYANFNGTLFTVTRGLIYDIIRNDRQSKNNDESKNNKSLSNLTEKKYVCIFPKTCIRMRIGWRNMRVKFHNPLISL
jgi:hypothetical protein